MYRYLRYSNVAATLALLFAVGGGTALGAARYVSAFTVGTKPRVAHVLASPAVLAKGQTEIGIYAIRSRATVTGEATADDPITFSTPLTTAPRLGGASQCTGTVTDPTAAPGYLCLYSGQSYNFEDPTVIDAGGIEGETNTFGFIYRGASVKTAPNEGDTISRGSWAVTAG